MTLSRLRQLVVLAAFLPAAAAAQQGTVNYTVTSKLEVELPPEFAHMQDQMPSETTAERILLFNEMATLTVSPPSEEDSVTDPSEMMESGGQQIVVRVRGTEGDDQTYVNLETGEVIEKREFLGRTFRIQDEATPLAWRLTGEQSEFLGYASQKAVAEQDSTTYEAWFTSEIPVSAGPESYGGLPGLILVLTVGNRTFEATSVDLNPLAEDAIAAPSDGREVTSEEFAEIVEERMRDMETSTFTTESGATGTRSFRVIRRGN
ncbi:MAG: GLPGLI family protein [Bacteroidota bacterium]